MNFPFSSTLNSFFLPALNLAKGNQESASEFSSASNLLEISDVSISDLSIHDDPIAAETSFVVRVQHRSQRPSPYQTRKPPDRLQGRRERTRLLPRVSGSKLQSSDESPIPPAPLPPRRRTLSEPSVLSVSSAGQYKCVFVKSPGTVMHPETNTPVLHLKTELPPGLSLEALSRNFDRTSKDASSRSCQIVPTGELNGGPDTLLKALNSWCSTHLGVPSPGWNALQITEVESSERSFDIPESSPFCLLQYGGSDTLQIFPDTKSAKPHNLLLEIPMGPISTILVSSSIAAGSTISSTRIPGSVGSNTPTFQVIPIRTPEVPAPQALGNHVCFCHQFFDTVCLESRSE